MRMDNYLGKSANYLINIEETLIKDEILMRLLYYKPQSDTTLDPLDPNLPDIVDEDSLEYWDIVTERVRRGSKLSDIVNKQLVVIYLYHGRERSVFRNRTLSTQEVKFDIYIHESYESDFRMDRIRNRLSQLLMGEIGIAGIGRMRKIGTNDREAPIQYRKKEDIYVYSTGIK